MQDSFTCFIFYIITILSHICEFYFHFIIDSIEETSGLTKINVDKITINLLLEWNWEHFFVCYSCPFTGICGSICKKEKKKKKKKNECDLVIGVVVEFECPCSLQSWSHIRFTELHFHYSVNFGSTISKTSYL